MSEELINYIKENQAKGVPEDQIRQTLLTSGWQQADIDAAFTQLSVPQAPNPPIPTTQTQPSSLNLKEHKPFFLAKKF